MQLRAASRISAAVKGLIYSKIFKVSTATNKKFKKGDLINLLTEDANKMSEFIWKIPNTTSLPMLALV
jgi:ABC-type transport system involved in cytochrome bd biosynthesis fused ATPase/permease subunit